MDKYVFSKEQRSVLEGMQAPFAVYQFLNKRVVTLILSDGFCDLFGYTDRAAAYSDMDNDMYRDTHPDDVARIANAALRFATEGGSYEVVYRTLASDGGWKIVHAVGKHVITEDGVQLAHIWYTDEGAYTENSDAAETRLSRTLISGLHEESFLKASHYDHLTGLPSMTYFFDLAMEGRDAILRDGGQPVLLYLDLRGMKYFNDKYSFAEGDKLLKEFARLLSRRFSNESCCRIGQDHFAVFTTEDGLEETLETLFRDSERLNGGNSLPVRVGIYSARIEAVPVSQACDRAKLACDAIKEQYCSSFNYYRDEIRDNAKRRLYVQSNLDRAIAEHWIQIYYQPIIRAANGKICDSECLSRWVDPEEGLLPPCEFIPYLEDSGQIYKLDLYVLDQVLERMKIRLHDEGRLVPHSINLSRSDFSACDIVEEIRSRVDAAGVPRNMVAVEITESTIGSDFDRIRAQLERFRELGFSVWLDDFGSGYSSMEALQSIPFNVVKFDMSFMQKLDESERSKIVLTELMKLVTSLGSDTVCEGVETEAQVRFLREIGCAKMQGYYFSPPVSPAALQERHRKGLRIGFENPAEVPYYEAIGKVNLYDLAMINSDSGDGRKENAAFQNFFNSLPMGIIEVRDDKTRFVRSNQSYRDFIKRFFGYNLSYEGSDFVPYDDSFMNNVVKTCCEQGIRSFYDEKMPNGSIIHSFARRIGVNPVDGTIAVAVAVLSITDADSESATYAGIARALAADYYNIYCVELDTERYIEYRSDVGVERLTVERHGEGFFESSRRDAMTRIYEEDRASFLKAFTKKNIIRALDRDGVFTIIYRLIESGEPMYVNMKITRMLPDRNRIIMGISIVDAQMKQQEEEARARHERVALGRIAALSGNYIVIYSVDPETNQYVEFSADADFGKYGLAKDGEDFFEQVRVNSPKAVHPEDFAEYTRLFTRENVLREIGAHGLFALNYRLVLNGRAIPVSLRAAIVREDDGEKLIVGINRVEN